MHVYDDIRHTLTPIRATDRLSIREECHFKDFVEGEPDETGRRIIYAYVLNVYYCIAIRNGRRESEMLRFLSESDAQKELDNIVKAMKDKEAVYTAMYNVDDNKALERTVRR
jgi:hypothetical protein